MKRLPLVAGLLSVSALFLIGCPVASTQQATHSRESDVTPVAGPPPIDPFVPRSPLDGLQDATPARVPVPPAPIPESQIPAPEPVLEPQIPEAPIPAPEPVLEPQVPESQIPAPQPVLELQVPESQIPALEPTPEPAPAQLVEQSSPSESMWAPLMQPSSFVDVPATPVSVQAEAPQSFAEPVAEVPVPETPVPEDSRPQIVEGDPAPYDPIKANGEYFVDWPKPKLLLVFTGFIDGYVEPCGCAGLEQMKGGLSRRRTFFQELEKKGWPTIPIDAGNLNKGFGRQEELKYNFVVDESLRQMKYEMIGLGNRELLFPTDALILYSVDVPGSPRRYTSANIVLLDDPNCTTPFRTQTMNGVKVGVISVIGKSMFGNINNPNVRQLDVVDSLKEVLPKFDAEECNQRVLIVHGSNAEFQAVLKAFPNRFDFVLCSAGPAEPPREPQWIGNTMNVEVGEKGKYAVAVGLFDGVDRPMRYQRVALDSRFKNSPDVMQAMEFYQEQLKVSGLEGLGIKAIPNRRAAESGKYVGSQTCADCHEPAQIVWRRSKHAQAWKSLADTAKPARTFDPECIACHVVGWSPGEFLPYENGFMSEEETPHLIDVGCESCHGPGEQHVAAEVSIDDALKQKLRQAMRLSMEGNAAKRLCIECHDGDNSPLFDFETYWPKIQHKEE